MTEHQPGMDTDFEANLITDATQMVIKSSKIRLFYLFDNLTKP